LHACHRGQKKFTIDSIQKIISGLGLKGKAGTYFENLVYLNQAKTLDEKEHFFQRAKKIGNKNEVLPAP